MLLFTITWRCVRLFSELPSLGSPATALLLFVPLPMCQQQSSANSVPSVPHSDFRTQNIHHNNEEERPERRPLVQPNLHLKLCFPTHSIPNTVLASQRISFNVLAFISMSPLLLRHQYTVSFACL